MDPLDQLLSNYLAQFFKENGAGRELAHGLEQIGIGTGPLIDHCTIRTHDVDSRARQFLELGYTHDKNIGVLEFDHWWAKVYRKPGHPALFIDQAFDGARGEQSLISDWVDHHGDQCFHHIAILVENINDIIKILNGKGFRMAGPIIGETDSDLRQVFTEAELKDGQVYSVLELIERHNGYDGFLPPQPDGLMESTRR